MLFRSEFGFFGVWVKTRTHTPRFCGLLCSAGLFVLLRTFSRPLRTNWLIVGIDNPNPNKSFGDDASSRDAVAPPKRSFRVWPGSPHGLGTRHNPLLLKSAVAMGISPSLGRRAARAESQEASASIWQGL